VFPCGITSYTCHVETSQLSNTKRFPYRDQLDLPLAGAQSQELNSDKALCSTVKALLMVMTGHVELPVNVHSSSPCTMIPGQNNYNWYLLSSLVPDCLVWRTLSYASLLCRLYFKPSWFDHSSANLMKMQPKMLMHSKVLAPDGTIPAIAVSNYLHQTVHHLRPQWTLAAIFTQTRVEALSLVSELKACDCF
jgi:hypothetical protein